MNEYNKILRNKVAKSLEELGDEYNIVSLNKEETIEYLYSNLISSIYDIYNTKSLSSIVDSIDLLISIANQYGFNEYELKNLRTKINNEMGTYSNKVISDSDK